MTETLRPDGKPFVFDKHGSAPRYVIEDDENGHPVVLNQFTGASAVISESRPYAKSRIVSALRRIGGIEQ